MESQSEAISLSPSDDDKSRYCCSLLLYLAQRNSCGFCQLFSSNVTSDVVKCDQKESGNDRVSKKTKTKRLKVLEDITNDRSEVRSLIERSQIELKQTTAEVKATLDTPRAFKEWNCSMCTYCNSKRATKCAMCGSKK